LSRVGSFGDVRVLTPADVEPIVFFPRDGLIFSRSLLAIPYAETVSNPPGSFQTHIMAPALSLKIADAGARHAAPPVKRNNVIPFPSRVLLPVSFMRESDEMTRTQLRALVHSPLGVYVTTIERVRNEVSVELDIAPDDLDFTLHTLIATLPVATIGRISRRVGNAGAR
jgi:hypothetical protein